MLQIIHYLNISVGDQTKLKMSIFKITLKIEIDTKKFVNSYQPKHTIYIFPYEKYKCFGYNKLLSTAISG